MTQFHRFNRQTRGSIVSKRMFVRGLFVFAFVLLGVAGIHQPVHAVYECGTYGAGDFGDDNYNTASCDTTTTTPTDTGSGTTTGSGSTSTGNTTSITPTVDDTTDTTPVTVTDGESIFLDKYTTYSVGNVKLVDMSVGQIVYFDISGVSHSITLKERTDDYIVVSISSIPKEVKIVKGATVTVDANDDKTDDIKISYVGSVGEIATVGFQKPTAATTSTTTDTTAADDSSSKSPNFAFLLWVIPLAIIVLIVIILIVRKIAASRTAVQ